MKEKPHVMIHQREQVSRVKKRFLEQRNLKKYSIRKSRTLASEEDTVRGILEYFKIFMKKWN